MGNLRFANLVSNFELLRTSKTPYKNSSFQTRTKFGPIPKNKPYSCPVTGLLLAPAGCWLLHLLVPWIGACGATPGLLPPARRRCAAPAGSSPSAAPSAVAGPRRTTCPTAGTWPCAWRQRRTCPRCQSLARPGQQATDFKHFSCLHFVTFLSSCQVLRMRRRAAQAGRQGIRTPLCFPM